MVARLVRDGRVRDPRLALAFLRVRRHLFVPTSMADQAYDVDALEVMDGQTITCPGYVAQMTSLLEVGPGARVLDIGTGTGYQAAILSALGCKVVSIEIRKTLHEFGRANLQRAGFNDVVLIHGDGALGAPEHGPFDAIVLACAPEELPKSLLDQLILGGRMVGPEGRVDALQTLVRLTKTQAGHDSERIRGAWFVPMETSQSTYSAANP